MGVKMGEKQKRMSERDGMQQIPRHSIKRQRRIDRRPFFLRRANDRFRPVHALCARRVDAGRNS